MLRKIAFAVLAVLLLACAGVLYSRSRGAIVPGLDTPPLAEALAGPLASGDSTVVADFAQARCRLLRGAAERQCYEDILYALVERNEVRLAMTSLEVLSQRDPDIVSRGHDYTHVVGINAWTPGEDVGQVYESCTGLFQSGCYHGVVQAYLDANGADSSVVSSLCDLIPTARTNLWLRFQCVHGLGHGLVQAKKLHLPRALAGCDWLADRWDAESCYGGAFMEFIVAGRGQSHHPHGPGRGADSTGEEHAGHDPPAATTAATEHSHDEHAGHDMAAAPADTFPIRDPADPLFPCSALDRRYQRSCYGMQAGIVIENTGSDFGKIAAACDGAPLDMRPACYQGIGTYVSGFTVRDADRSIDLCMKGNPEWRPWCFVGVVKNFIDVTADPADGFAFCRRLDDLVIGVSCYVAVGEQMAVLKTPLTERDRLCDDAAEHFRPACRYGAGISPNRPPELPDFSPGP